MLRPKILVVEDESIVAMDLKQRLIGMEYRVIGVASSGAAALDQVSAELPDLVLMDIQIKGDMDGIETADILQEKYNLPIVFLTANSDIATVERAKKTGPLAYLLKPFEDRDLMTTIEIALHRHKLECDLRAQKEWWSTTLNSIGDGVLTTDTDSIVTFLNPVAKKLTQFPSNKAIGLPLDQVFPLISEETGKPVLSPVTKVLETGATVLLSNHVSLTRPDGSQISIEDRAAPILSAKKEVIGAVLVFHDVTTQRTREHNSKEYQDQLEATVAVRTGELLKANEQLRQEMADREKSEEERTELQLQLERAERMKALGLLAGGIAHDLNNMLGPLVGYPELILRKLPDDSPIRKQIERIASSAKDAASVIQDLLTLARRGRYEMLPFSANEMIQDYLDSPSFETLCIEHPEIEVITDLEDDMPPMNGSAPHLSKVVMNLVVNAVDAIKNKGTLSISTKSEHIDRLRTGYDSFKPGEHVIITIKDDGCGIRPEDLDKIFEPYYSNKEMQGRSGSGLGLSVVYGIVKDHDGFYDIISSPDRGTEFILYFPTSVDAPTEDKDALDFSGGNEVVLVVDDNENQRELQAEILTSLGYEVMLAENGTEAVRSMQTREFDLILLDMIMEEGFDGLDTYREIIKHRPGQKAIIVSGFSASARVDEAIRLGVGAYVKKPFELKTIAHAVRTELDRSLTNVPG